MLFPEEFLAENQQDSAKQYKTTTKTSTTKLGVEASLSV